MRLFILPVVVLALCAVAESQQTPAVQLPGMPTPEACEKGRKDIFHPSLPSSIISNEVALRVSYVGEEASRPRQEGASDIDNGISFNRSPPRYYRFKVEKVLRGPTDGNTVGATIIAKMNGCIDPKPGAMGILVGELRGFPIEARTYDPPGASKPLEFPEIPQILIVHPVMRAYPLDSANRT